MTDKERVIFEIDIAIHFYNRWTDEIEKWLSYTEPRIIKVLES